MAKIEIKGVICADGWGYDDDTMPAGVMKQLEVASEDGEIDLRIDSYGGDVLAANSIGNAIAAWCMEHPGAKCTCTVGALAASAAANLLARIPKCFKRQAYEDSLVMYHSCYGLVCGGPEAMRDNAVMMDLVNDMAKNALKSRTTLDKDRVDEAFREGREMWLTGAEARECGLVDGLIDGMAGEIEEIDENRSEYRLVASAVKSLKAHKEAMMAEIDEKKALEAKAEEEEEKDDVPPVDAECDDENKDAQAECGDDEKKAEANTDEEPGEGDAPEATDDPEEDVAALKQELESLKQELESLKAKYSVKAPAVVQTAPKKDFAALVREIPKGLSQDKYADAYSKLKAEHMAEYEAYMQAHQTR